MKSLNRSHNAVLRAVAMGLFAVLVGSSRVEAQPRHGMWVSGVVPRTTGMCLSGVGLLDEDPDANQVLDFAAANPITEVYLSIGPQAAALSDSRFPNFIGSLKSSGLKVEALIGCSGVSNCQGGTWKTRIDQVTVYNDGASALERFDGIHLDLEPWVNTGTDFSWVDDLIADYQYASSVLEGSGLTLAADISGVKVINDMIDPQKRQALLDAATRLVLMEYEEPSVDRIYQRVDTFRNTIDLSAASFTIATRVQDFGFGNSCQNGTVLRGFDDNYTPAPGYAGWATFKYSDSGDCNHYNDRSICPGDCCIIRP
jgi:hypothetical protein